MRKPNLFVIGAMKCGTTSLHEYLNTHPQIAMSQEKEPGYFVEELTLHKGEDWYLSLFDQDTRYRYVGESSTQYTMLPKFKGVSERIFRFNPHARLIYIMRDPLERTLSHYWHAVRVRNQQDGGGEPRPLLTAVREQPRYLDFSDYAMQLKPYLERFGRDSVYTLTFESLTADPQSELDRIYHWLDLPSHPLGEQARQAHNQKPKELMVPSGAGLLYRIQFSEAWDLMSPCVPHWLKKWAKGRAQRSVDEQQLSREIALLRAEVGERQRLQIDRLAGMLQRDFPEWTTEDRDSEIARAAVGGVPRPAP